MIRCLLVLITDIWLNVYLTRLIIVIFLTIQVELTLLSKRLLVTTGCFNLAFLICRLNLMLIDEFEDDFINRLIDNRWCRRPTLPFE